jgi:hypothetical protein
LALSKVQLKEEIVDTGTTEDLYAISGDGHEVYVVGSNNTFLRYDGTAWKQIEVNR